MNNNLDLSPPEDDEQRPDESGEQSILPALSPAASESIASEEATHEQPEPEAESAGPRYRVSASGVYVRTDKGEKRICAPIELVAMVRTSESEGWAKLLRWKDHDGTQHERAIPMGALIGEATAIARDLVDGGLEIMPGAANDVRDYLNTLKTDVRYRLVRHTGWHGGAFVLSDRVIGATPGGEQLVLQSDMPSVYRVSGTLDDWQQEVAALCVGNSRLLLSVSTAFAAILTGLTDYESGGVHLVGSSSTGKTTAALVAASVFGDANFLQRWRATANGLEAMAAQHNHMLLILDEIAQVDPGAAGETAYMLANGQGKQRASRTGGVRARQTWRLMFLSTGEIGLAQHMASGGKRVRAGQEVRLIDLQADAGANLGVFENLHGEPDGAAFAARLKQAITRYHGTAALEFIERCANEPGAVADEVKQLTAKAVESWIGELAQEPEGQVRRVAERFAFIAASAEVATALGITAWEHDDATTAARRCFMEWVAERGTPANMESKLIIEQVRQFLARHGEGRFQSLDPEAPGERRRTIYNRAGWKKTIDAQVEYFLDRDVFKTEVCAGFDPRTVCRVLNEAECMLAKVEDGKLRYALHRHLGDDGKRRVHVITSDIWTVDEDDAPASSE